MLPDRWGFLEITHPNIVVSALKAGKDGCAVLRIYEAAGISTKSVEIKLSAQIISAEEVNLMEDPGQKLNVASNILTLDFRPFEIKTIKLYLEIN
jgi:alpha-mannosidase